MRKNRCRAVAQNIRFFAILKGNQMPPGTATFLRTSNKYVKFHLTLQSAAQEMARKLYGITFFGAPYTLKRNDMGRLNLYFKAQMFYVLFGCICLQQSCVCL